MLTATWSPHSPGIWCDIDTRGCEKRAVFDPKLSHFGDLLHDKRVAIVDDTLTTGETLRQVTALVEQHHGQVVSAATIVDRSQDLSAKEYGVPEVHSLLSIDGIRTYPPDECPQCLAKKPINLRPGHGERWLRKNSAYPQAL